MDAHTTALLGSAPTAAMPSQTLDPHRLGSVLDGRYELLSVLGEGGHGIVYRAQQLSTDQIVAIKLLRAQVLNRSDLAVAVARFDREMRLIAKLSHPNIVRLIDSGRLADSSIYTVLELIEGESLADLLDREGCLAPRQAKRLMGQVLDALSCAHQMGIVHRDLKPENIMIATTGARRNAMVLDFGIAALVEEARAADYRSLTAEGQINGTPHYMAPEQLLGEHPTPQTDLYAWGLIFAEVLTGQTVVDGATLISIISQQISRDPIELPPAVLQGPLGPLIARSVTKPLALRYSSAVEVLGDLEECHLDDETAPMSALARSSSGSFPSRTGLSRSARQPSSPSLLHLVAETWVFWLNENDSGVTAFVLACSNQASRMWRRLMPPAVTRLRPHEKVGIVASTGMTALVLFISLVVWVARASDVPPSPVEVVAAMPRAAAAVAAAGPRGEAKRPVPLPEPAAEEPDVVAPRTAGEPTVAPRVPTSVQRAAGPVQVEGTLGAKMVWIKAGLFQMGLSDDDLHHYASLCEDSPNPACSSERWGASRPAHIRDPAPFYVDTHEVTNAEYQECIDTRTCPKLKATQCELIGSAGDFATRRLTRKRKAAMAVRVTSGDLPAACVSRVEAATYCHWASKRLPSEAEWEFAASSGGERLFPWGPLDGRGLQPINGADQALAVVMEWDGILADSVGQHRDAYAFAASVGSFEDGRTPSGLEDISGNVAEWVSDPYEPYASDNSRRSSLREGVVRGGSWADFGPALSTKARRAMEPTRRRADVGFRCARDGQ